MDKYSLCLMPSNIEKYTSEQLAEILSDSGNREIYNLLCKADSAIEAEKDINVDAEWENFSEGILSATAVDSFGSVVVPRLLPPLSVPQ